MTETTLNQFISSGTNAERLAYTPVLATPAAGNDPSVVFIETDTGDSYMWDFGGSAWLLTSSGGGGITALTGDVTATGPGSAAATIANNSVTLAKVAHAAANSKILGSGASGSGANYVELTLGTNLSMSGTTLNATGGGTPGGSSGDIQYNNAGAFGGFTMSGDVTVVPSTGVSTIGALKIATGMIQASAVTLAKVQNAAASSRLLGSGSGGSGAAYTELTLGAGLSMSASALSGSGNLIGVQTITATGSGTYTPTSGTNSVVIELVGGGGGGSGVASPGSGNANLGGGGSGGGWLRKRLTVDFSGASYVVGAKGSGGTAGNNNGSDGADTTFTTTSPSSTTYTAKKGLGAGHNGGFAPPLLASSAAASATTGGDVTRDGGTGLTAFAINTSLGVSGAGGSSVYSPGAQNSLFAVNNSSNAGVNATGHGGGGSGGCAVGTGGAVAGGNGSDGMIIIWEYS